MNSVQFSSERELPSHLNLFQQMADAVYLLDPKTSNVLWCNRIAYEELGYSEDEVLNHSVLSLQKDVKGAPQWSEIATVIRSKNVFTFVGRHLHKDGYEIPVEVNTTHFWVDGHEYFLSVARNISNRVAFEKDFQERDGRIRYALHEVSDGLWEWELESDYVFFSPQLKKMLGYGPDEMTPHVDTWKSKVHPDDVEKVITILSDHIKGKRPAYQAEYRLRNRNGHYIWVHDAGKVCERNDENQPTHVIGMVRNISDHKKVQTQLESLAHEDVLTGLPNRRHGERSAQKALKKACDKKVPLTLAVIDLDFFKRINDLYGHAKGDEILVFIAQLLNSARPKKSFLYRWGGEEFVLILPNYNLEAVQEVLGGLHQVIAQADWTSLGVEPVTLSIGAVECSQANVEFNECFKLADLAVYQAKANGRNQTVLA